MKLVKRNNMKILIKISLLILIIFSSGCFDDKAKEIIIKDSKKPSKASLELDNFLKDMEKKGKETSIYKKLKIKN